MDITITPQKLSGTINAIASKSQAHRILICAAFSDIPCYMECHETNEDIEATARCLNAIGAKITRKTQGYEITPVKIIPNKAVLDCGESGSTLRFILPIVGALGIQGTFLLSGRLPKRPLSPLWEEMERMGCSLCRPSENTVQCTGKLQPGQYCIDGSVSSQYITGLFFAMALIKGDTKLRISGKIESVPYIQMTRDVLAQFGVATSDNQINTSYPLKGIERISVEGDWSNGAFFLAAKSLGNNITVTGLDVSSSQGDRACLSLFDELSENIHIDAADIPDLVPILSVVAAAKKGATFQNIGRLRLKESDRVKSVCDMLGALGAKTEVNGNTMQVFPAPFHECVVDSVGDHRIAMAAAIAATVSLGPVTILNAQCVNKSYPSFWNEYKNVGGQYEQYIR